MSEAHPFMHFNVIRYYRQKGKVEHKLMDQGNRMNILDFKGLS